MRQLFCHSARQENPDKREEEEGKSREVKHGPLISLFSLSACTLEYWCPCRTPWVWESSSAFPYRPACVLHEFLSFRTCLHIKTHDGEGFWWRTGWKPSISFWWQRRVTWHLQLICTNMWWQSVYNQWRLVLKNYGRSGPSSLILFFLHPSALWTGIFV